MKMTAAKFKTKREELQSIAQIAKDKENAKLMQGEDKSKATLAFNQIYMRYKDSIYFYTTKFVNLNKEVSDDLTQEIFVKIFRKINTYDFSTNLSTWMFNVAKNHIIDYKRKEKYEVLSIETLRSEYGGDEDVNQISFQLIDRSSDTFNVVVKQERASAVHDALLNGVKCKNGSEIIRLLFIEDLTYEKVAERLGIPIGTVKAIMFRSKSEMKEHLSRKNNDFTYA